jgi:hypothetical protein
MHPPDDRVVGRSSDYIKASPESTWAFSARTEPLTSSSETMARKDARLRDVWTCGDA